MPEAGRRHLPLSGENPGPRASHSRQASRPNQTEGASWEVPGVAGCSESGVAVPARGGALVGVGSQRTKRGRVPTSSRKERAHKLWSLTGLPGLESSDESSGQEQSLPAPVSGAGNALAGDGSGSSPPLSAQEESVPTESSPTGGVGRSRDGACPHCPRLFATYPGRRLHERKAHPEVFFAGEIARLESQGNLRGWSTEAVERMAYFEADRIEDPALMRRINLEIQGGLFPRRTVDAIKGERRKSSYSTLLRGIVEERRKTIAGLRSRRAGQEVGTVPAAECSQSSRADALSAPGSPGGVSNDVRAVAPGTGRRPARAEFGMPRRQAEELNQRRRLMLVARKEASFLASSPHGVPRKSGTLVTVTGDPTPTGIRRREPSSPSTDNGTNSAGVRSSTFPSGWQPEAVSTPAPRTACVGRSIGEQSTLDVSALESLIRDQP